MAGGLMMVNVAWARLLGLAFLVCLLGLSALGCLSCTIAWRDFESVPISN